MNKAFPLKSTLMSIVLIIAGSFIYYFWWYKEDHLWIRFTALGLPAFGWLMILTNIKEAYLKDAPVFAKFGIALLFILMVFINVHIVSGAEENRINSIFTSGKTKNTIATVTKLEQYRNRSGWRRYAIINYQTDNKNLSIGISNDDQKYMVGEHLEIKYAVDYPDMIRVAKILSSN